MRIREVKEDRHRTVIDRRQEGRLVDNICIRRKRARYFSVRKEMIATNAAHSGIDNTSKSDATHLPFAKLMFSGGDKGLGGSDLSEIILTSDGTCFGRLETSNKDKAKFPHPKFVINKPFISGTHFTVSRKKDENGQKELIYLQG